MINLGMVRPGQTIYIPWDTFDGGTGASITSTGLAVGDILVYKDGGMTQRASTSGFTLLDTDGIDLDAITGIQGISIDLADNTTAGFWAAGSKYYVVISSVTIDAQTVNFVAAYFTIGYDAAILNTTIATLASQTSFTLTDGPAEDDAINGSYVIIHDVASKVQHGYAVVSDYTGSTKTVTLVAGTTFTAAAADNISVFPPVNIEHAARVAWGSGAITAASIATDAIGAAELADGAITAATFAAGAIDATAIATGAIDADALAADTITAAKIATGAITAAKFAAGAIDAAAIATDAIGAAELAADAVAEIADAVWDEVMSGHLTVGTYGQVVRALGLTGEVNDAAATTTAFIVDGFTEATNDHFNGMKMTFTSGANLGESRTITDYTGATQTMTFGQAWTDAPADNDDFVITPGEHGGATLAQTLRLFITLLSASGEIQATTLATGAITSAKFASGAIDAAAIATDAIGAAEIADGAITAATFAAGAIDATAVATGAIDADALAADAVTEIWGKAMSDLAAVPGATASALDALNWLFELARNKITQTATTGTVFKDDAATTLATTTVTDNGTTFTRGEYA